MCDVPAIKIIIFFPSAHSYLFLPRARASANKSSITKIIDFETKKRIPYKTKNYTITLNQWYNSYDGEREYFDFRINVKTGKN